MNSVRVVPKLQRIGIRKRKMDREVKKFMDDFVEEERY
jgi:hypothetical protein